MDCHCPESDRELETEDATLPRFCYLFHTSFLIRYKPQPCCRDWNTRNPGSKTPKGIMSRIMPHFVSLKSVLTNQNRCCTIVAGVPDATLPNAVCGDGRSLLQHFMLHSVSLPCHSPFRPLPLHLKMWILSPLSALATTLRHYCLSFFSIQRH